MVDGHGNHRLVARLFHLAATRLEASARLAGDGQVPGASPATLANELHGLADEVQILADAIIALGKPYG